MNPTPLSEKKINTNQFHLSLSSTLPQKVVNFNILWKLLSLLIQSRICLYTIAHLNDLQQNQTIDLKICFHFYHEYKNYKLKIHTIILTK